MRWPREGLAIEDGDNVVIALKPWDQLLSRQMSRPHGVFSFRSSQRIVHAHKAVLENTHRCRRMLTSFVENPAKMLLSHRVFIQILPGPDGCVWFQPRESRTGNTLWQRKPFFVTLLLASQWKSTAWSHVWFPFQFSCRFRGRWIWENLFLRKKWELMKLSSEFGKKGI